MGRPAMWAARHQDARLTPFVCGSSCGARAWRGRETPGPRADFPLLAADGFTSVVRQESGRAVSPAPVTIGPLRVLVVYVNAIPELTIERFEETLAGAAGGYDRGMM